MIQNSGFENWYLTSQGWEDPTDWTSSNSTVLGGDSAVYQTSDSYAGSYAAEIQTVTIGFAGLPYAGILVNGTIDFNQVNSIDDLIEAGTPISLMPTELQGFYKYTQQNIGDSAYVRVIVKKYNSLTKERDTVAWAEARLPAASSYTPFNITINELLPSVIPDSIVLMFLSKHPDEQLATGLLIVDEISLVNATGTNDLGNLLEGITIFPNPTSGMLSIIKLPPDEIQVSVFNILGELMITSKWSGSTKATLDLTDFEKGLYFIQVQTRDRSLTKKAIKQ
jgi:hypothetical protein